MTIPGFYPSTFVHSHFPQRWSFFTVCLVQWFRGVTPWGFPGSGKEWGRESEILPGDFFTGCWKPEEELF